jgi:hypothetical protein
MGFDPYNCSMKIRKSIKTPIPKVGALKGSFSHTLLHSREHEMWLPGFPLGPQPCKPLLWSRAQGQGYDIYLQDGPMEDNH